MAAISGGEDDLPPLLRPSILTRRKGRLIIICLVTVSHFPYLVHFRLDSLNDLPLVLLSGGP